MKRKTLVLGGLALTAALAAGLPTDATARVPKPDKSKPNARAKAYLVREGSGDVDAKGRVEVSIKKDGRFSFRVQGQRLSAGTAVDFTIEDAQGIESTYASGVVGDGSTHVFLKSQNGDTLPDGASSPADLSGRAIRVRAGATSTGCR